LRVGNIYKKGGGAFGTTLKNGDVVTHPPAAPLRLLTQDYIPLVYSPYCNRFKSGLLKGCLWLNDWDEERLSC